MKRLILYFPILMMLLIAACSEETELKKSVFIPDDVYPDLPAYSEWGYNTFGAYYDMVPFISNETGVPAKMINTGGKTSFALKGHLSTQGHYYYYDYYDNSNEASLIFDFYSFDPQVYTDLISLNNLTVDLTSSSCRVRVIRDTASYDLEILSGSLFFKRAQNLFVDTKHVEVILSGTFEFQALVEDDEPISVTLGRFDVGIGYGNFFRY
jgi:hypothetical protein